MEASVLLGGINRSVFATADDELRPVMNGIYFDITTEDITMVVPGFLSVHQAMFSLLRQNARLYRFHSLLQ